MTKNKKNNDYSDKYYIDLYSKYYKFLTQSQRQVFELYFLEGFTISKIADIIVTTRQATYDSLKKAKEKLIKIFEKMEGME
ncbi:helix-turn-helix domain-containing protein [Mesomycoplasma neurolyticum]|uniref:Putative UPF0122 protein MCAP_0480 n=1 Tax=Mesomycoplasma neurolyticum TaxID=2120 RepID=A0A449A623_9BACT|nr:hypothetical protein [Mesomycoplasma neurolyticum]VEU59672.1 putative UPF0122 protein MCAP_0480 [Mesomycoplasma neurolyticum]